MRTTWGIVFCLVAVFCCSLSFAYTVQVKECIASKYLLITIYGAEPDKPLDKKYILDVAYTESYPDVEQLQIAIYDKGKVFGDGARALFVKNKEGLETLLEGEPYEEELYLGYMTLTPFMLNDFFSNKTEAEDVYKNNTFLLNMLVWCVERDESGEIYLYEEPDKAKRNMSVKVYVNKDDPFLQEIEVGDVATIRGNVINLSDKVITLKGKVVNMYRPPSSD